MGSYSELIKSFGKTRDYIRDFFIYGCKVRNDFKAKSSRTYDDEKRRAESWLGDYVSFSVNERGKQTAITLDSDQIAENPLYNAYYSKSFTDNDIKLHFLITDILADGRSLSVRQITEELSSEYGMTFDEQTVRNKIKEYTAEGIIVSKNEGKTLVFCLSEIRTDSLISSTEGLSDAVKLFSEAAVFGVLGNSIMRSLAMKNDLFRIKHNYIVHTLEDEILLSLTEAAAEHRYVRFTNNSPGRTQEEYRGLPLQIRVSTQTGRRFAIMYMPAYKRFSSYRLDYIKTVTADEPCSDYDDYIEKLRRNSKYCFGVSFGSPVMRKNVGGRASVRFVFHADEKREPFIINRLIREKRCGEVNRIAENTYEYTAEVFDPNEMMHWIKSFIGRITYADCADKVITAKFYSDISRMYRMYCKEKEDV